MKATRKATAFGKAIRKRLIDLDMNQTDLARRIGTSKVTVTHIIYGDRNPGRWKNPICNVLGIAPPKDAETEYYLGGRQTNCAPLREEGA